MFRKAVTPGSVSVLIDGGFGSSGKGLVAGAIAASQNIDVAAASCSPNAGHTCYVGDRKVVAFHLPMAAAINPKCGLYLCAGSIIRPKVLLREVEELNIDPARLTISPRAVIVKDSDVDEEKDPTSAQTKLGSTREGVGVALAHKVKRTTTGDGITHLAVDEPSLKGFVVDHPLDVEGICDVGGRVFLEIPQGLGLGVNSGLAYPFCTSREISISQALSDLQVHPRFLGAVTMVMRTYPIRVGNIASDDGYQIGYSGPFYPDSEETSWDEIGVPEELTTVTKRVRRVAKFSTAQYQWALKKCRPDVVVLNFVNYLKSDAEFSGLLGRMINEETLPMTGLSPSHVFGLGPRMSDLVSDVGEVVKRMGWEAD